MISSITQLSSLPRWCDTLDPSVPGPAILTRDLPRAHKVRPTDEGLVNESDDIGYNPSTGDPQDTNHNRNDSNDSHGVRDSNSDDHARQIIFPFSASINAQVSLTCDDPLGIACDAVVNPTNESLSDRSGIAGRLHAAAGPDLHAECMDTWGADGCRTGEARVTRGHRLPAKFVVHTVGPRYNVKYRTAAENALHGCYRTSLEEVKGANLRSVVFPCVYSVRKGYPREDAAHVALRTVRRFLERWGDNIDRVVFSTDGDDSDYEIYSRLTPLYFPRSEEEADIAASLLPEDTGNELGEAVTDERRIKIAASFGSTSVYSGGNDSGVRDSSITSSSSSSNTNSNSASGPGSSSSAAAHANASNSDVPSSSRGASNPFGSMRGDPDRDRAERAAAEPVSAEVESERKYQRYLRRARTEDLSDLEKMNIVRVTGVDPLTRRPIVMVVGRNFPKASEVEMERLLLLFIKVLDTVVEREYILVYVHTHFSKENQPEYSWLKSMHELFSRKYKKNLKALYLVHPTFWVKMIFWFLTPFLSKKFWAKLVYVPKLHTLFEKVDRQQLDIPHEVFEYDAEVNGTDYIK